MSLSGLVFRLLKLYPVTKRRPERTADWFQLVVGHDLFFSIGLRKLFCLTGKIRMVVEQVC